MRVVFMGTPDFAVGALESIIQAGHDVAAVVTQPDKPKGRGKGMQMTPVKACAVLHEIPVFQPVKVKESDAVEQLRKYGADVFVVAAFGQILSQEILTMPKYGCVNIHASLLPKYRGAAPIQWAIINGERTTGVTIMQMDRGIDTGDMLMKDEVPISARETADSLHDKLAQTGARLIVEALAKIEKGEITPVRQNEEESCYAKMLHKSMSRIDWQQDAVGLDCLIRGLISWPGASCVYRGKMLKMWQEEVDCEDGKTEETVAEESSNAQTSAPPNDAEPGTIVRVEKDSFYVQTGEGILKITAVQPEGKKHMAVRDFLLGYPMKAGEKLE